MARAVACAHGGNVWCLRACGQALWCKGTLSSCRSVVLLPISSAHSPQIACCARGVSSYAMLPTATFLLGTSLLSCQGRKQSFHPPGRKKGKACVLRPPLTLLYVWHSVCPLCMCYGISSHYGETDQAQGDQRKAADCGAHQAVAGEGLVQRDHICCCIVKGAEGLISIVFVGCVALRCCFELAFSVAGMGTDSVYQNLPSLSPQNVQLCSWVQRCCATTSQKRTRTHKMPPWTNLPRHSSSRL